MGETFFRVRVPEVTFEDFKNEILIIDLKTGHYHSLRGSAACLWRMVEAGEGLTACVAGMKRLYPADCSSLESDTTTFLQELEETGLIARVGERGVATEVPFDIPVENYQKPIIDSYGDLQDLLLLDPIHEIAPEAGWPKRREEA